MFIRTAELWRPYAMLTLWGVALLGLGCGGSPEPPEPSVKDEPERVPNILILMADDWNWPQSEGVSDPNLGPRPLTASPPKG